MSKCHNIFEEGSDQTPQSAELMSTMHIQVNESGVANETSLFKTENHEDNEIVPKAFDPVKAAGSNEDLERSQEIEKDHPDMQDPPTGEKAENVHLPSVPEGATPTIARGTWTQRKCVLCHKILTKKKDLEYHMLEHYMPQLMSQLPTIPPVSGPFICAECGYHFPNVSKLLWHYGFFHKYIMKFSKECELQGEVVVGPTVPIYDHNYVRKDFLARP